MQQVILRIKIPDWILDLNPVIVLASIALEAFIIRFFLVRRRRTIDPTFKAAGFDSGIVIVSLIVGAVWWGAGLLRAWLPEGVPVYGFGLMLFVAFVVCTWLACVLAERDGIHKE